MTEPTNGAGEVTRYGAFVANLNSTPPERPGDGGYVVVVLGSDYDKCAAALAEKDAEIRVAKAFHDEAIAERNAARHAGGLVQDLLTKAEARAAELERDCEEAQRLLHVPRAISGPLSMVESVKLIDAVVSGFAARSLASRKRAEATEARVAEVEESARKTGDHNVRLLRERDEALSAAAAQHRMRQDDIAARIDAERERDEARAKLAHADRLAEAAQEVDAYVYDHEEYPAIPREVVRNLFAALAEYRSGEPQPVNPAIFESRPLTAEQMFTHYGPGLAEPQPAAESEPSEVEVLRALDRSATRKRLDLEAEIRELKEWAGLIRLLARDYSGNMKLSKAIERADEAIDAAREAERDG